MASGPIFRFLSSVLASSDLLMEQKISSAPGKVKVKLQSPQSASLSLQQDYKCLNGYMGPRELSNGSTFRTDSKSGMQHMHDYGTVRSRRIYSKLTNE